MTTKRERTAARIFQSAIELFERDGYEATTVAAIAAEAGVSEMTFFRHFATKDALLLDDPYDPLIAAGIAAQPADLPPLMRAIAGVRTAWAEVPVEGAEVVRRRLRIAATTPALRGAISRNTLETERVVAQQLVTDGADLVAARIAAAALLAAMMAALLEWASTDDDRSMGSAIDHALGVLEGAS